MTRYQVEPCFTPDEAKRVIAALEASQEHELAKRVGDDAELAQLAVERHERFLHEQAEIRAKRAENHILTKRQAECLAAVRAGEGAFSQPYSYMRDGVVQWRWHRRRNTGGAIYRMTERLIEEGLLTDNRELTEAGLQRLEAWEEDHGRIGE